MIPNFPSQAEVPHKPGIYIYKDSSGEVLYVGKAIDLYNRVSSYFNSQWKDAKTSHLVQNIVDIETVVVESEIEALILEANLIKKFKPHYNLRLTDDKDYLYIVITDEEFPKVLTARKKDLIKVKKWFGPYPSATVVKTTLKKLRRIFPWCSSPPKLRLQSGIVSSKPIPDWKHKPCFYYHIGQCPGACVGEISKEDYHKILKRFSKFLDGKKEELIEELLGEMEGYSSQLKYEEAVRVRKVIEGINYITAPIKITNYLTDPNFLENLNQRSLEELQKALNLPELPERIEAYDISNFAGKEATGSMVVLTNGEIDKSQYRKFKIHITGRPNDVGMHKEMMRRRLGNLDWGVPQLILIDGGRGQVRGVHSVILSVLAKDLKIKPTRPSSGGRDSTSQVPLNDIKNVPIFGLAKRMEWLYPPEGEIIKLPKKSYALRLLQKIRNESHRFAITYHRKLRSRAFLPK